MNWLVAVAEKTDLSGSQWAVMLIGLLVIGVTAVLALIPIGLARYRRHRRADGITTATLVWGVATAASIIYFWLAKLTWVKEFRQEIMSGNIDPKNAVAPPAWPWAAWSILAATYIALTVFALSQPKPPEASGE
jgi:MFS superfamily sulfate permease-like transporter